MRINFLKKAALVAGSSSMLLSGCIDIDSLFAQLNLAALLGEFVNATLPVFSNSFGVSFGGALGQNLGGMDFGNLLGA